MKPIDHWKQGFAACKDIMKGEFYFGLLLGAIFGVCLGYIFWGNP